MCIGSGRSFFVFNAVAERVEWRETGKFARRVKCGNGVEFVRRAKCGNGVEPAGRMKIEKNGMAFAQGMKMGKTG